MPHLTGPTLVVLTVTGFVASVVTVGAPVCCVVARDVCAGATKSATAMNVMNGAISRLHHVTIFLFLSLSDR